MQRPGILCSCIIIKAGANRHKSVREARDKVTSNVCNSPTEEAPAQPNETGLSEAA